LSKNRYILQYIENTKTNLNSAHSTNLKKPPSWNINQHLQIFFNEIDTNKDGFITRDELFSALSKNTVIYEWFDSEKVKSLIAKSVSNNKFQINFKEFSSILTQINVEYGDTLVERESKNVIGKKKF